MIPEKRPVDTQPSGWICPRCGRSNSPYTSSCICQTYRPYRPEVRDHYYEYSGPPPVVTWIHYG